MESGAIPDSSLSVSSTDSGDPKEHSRLNYNGNPHLLNIFSLHFKENLLMPLIIYKWRLRHTDWLRHDHRGYIYVTFILSMIDMVQFKCSI